MGPCYMSLPSLSTVAGCACGGFLRLVLRNDDGGGTPQERLAAGIAFDDTFFFKVLLPSVRGAPTSQPFIFLVGVVPKHPRTDEHKTTAAS